MIISVVGNVDNVKNKINRYFGKLKPKKIISRKKIKEPLQAKIKKFVEKRKIFNSYMVLGYKTIPRMDKESYVLDVITAILGRGQSGWIFDEIRNKRGLAYQVSVHSEHESDYGYFAVVIGLDKKNIEKAKKLILQQFRKLEKTSNKELEEAKTYIEGNHTLTLEDNFHAADNLAFWETIKDASLSKHFINKMKKVNLSDIKRVSRRFLNDKYTLVVVEQE